MITTEKEYALLRVIPEDGGVNLALLSVDTIPVKGSISLNGGFVGIAPWSDYLEAGEYTISFGSVENYISPDDKVVTLKAGDNVSITGTFIPIEEEGKTMIHWIIAGAIAVGATALVVLKRKKK